MAATVQNRELGSPLISNSRLDGQKSRLSSDLAANLTTSKFAPKGISLKSSIQLVSKPSVLSSTGNSVTKGPLSPGVTTSQGVAQVKKREDLQHPKKNVVASKVPLKSSLCISQASLTRNPSLTQTGLLSSDKKSKYPPTQPLLSSTKQSTANTQFGGNLQSKLTLSTGKIGMGSLSTGISPGPTTCINTTTNMGIGTQPRTTPSLTASRKGVSFTNTLQSSSKPSLLLSSTMTTTTSTLLGGIKTVSETQHVSPLCSTQKVSSLSLTSKATTNTCLTKPPVLSPVAGTITVKPKKATATLSLSKSSLLLKSDAAKPFSSTSGPTQLGNKMPQSMIKSKQETFRKQQLVVPTDIEGMPKYEFGSSEPKITHEVQFLSPELDSSVQQSTVAAVDTERLKITLINAVATSLLHSPDFKDKKNPSTKHLTKLGKQVSHHDPEFILKLALYTRNELNIRTTANFLLALASNISYCRPFLKKYFSSCINLPSDWIEVAEIYQAFHDRSINFGSLPTALRRVMAMKFKSFDSYQLAKYNKDSSKKKKAKCKSDKKKGKPTVNIPNLTVNVPKPPAAIPLPPAPSKSQSESSESGSDTIVASDSESEEEMERLTFTLKQLIRKLHINDPVEHVMCLIGKRYPEDPEEFRRSGLPGIWDQDRAGKRMKLPTPETWETQISMKGNKAQVWEDLIDHKKLPFMAMLRNLRNMIIAQISPQHHQWVINRLTDERSVVSSRQFPFRFFSAYEVLNELEKREAVKPLMMGTVKGSNPLKKIKKVKEIPPVSPDLIKKYRNALDTALKIATHHNVKPIKGNTIVLCNVGSSMNRPCTSARGLGKPRTVLEIGLLLGLMCKYACEECTLALYGHNNYHCVSLEEGTILHNMTKLLDTIQTQGMSFLEGSIPPEFLKSLLIDQIVVDNLIVLTDQMNMDSRDGKGLVNFLNKYRNIVNPNLLFVSIDLSAKRVGVSGTIVPEHENDIHLAGYSDQMLRFIAERGDSGQLTHVENIDKKYKLKEVKLIALQDVKDLQKTTGSAEQLLIPTAPQKQWRTVRVFISSTFRDMHGERDLLTRYVFPELRRRCRPLFVNIFEVDLRWGITEQDTRSHKALEICLSEISRCNYFIGLLGNRYGWVPEKYEVPDSAEYDWVKEYQQGRSITELEMYHAAICNPDKAVGKAFFYFREPSASDNVPKEYQRDFKSELHADDQKMLALKTRIMNTGLETYNGYRGCWLGDVEGKPMLHKLEDFGQRVLYNLWNAIQRDFPLSNEAEDPLKQASKLNQAFFETQVNNFIGRHNLLNKACEKIDAMESGVLLATGKSGSGKSAFMAALAQHLMQLSNYHVVTHFIGATPGSTDISNILSRVCHEINRMFKLSQQLPEDYLELVREWPDFLGKGIDATNDDESKVIVLIDGIDLLDDKHNSRSMDWLPEAIPPRAVIVISAVESGTCHSVLRRHEVSPEEITVGVLDISDKAKIVRKKLAAHRKALDESPFNNQMKILMSKRDAGNPLYLQIACEELRMFGLFEEMTGFLKKMPATIATLLQEVLNRLEMEHGVELLSSSLAFLCIVRNGLKEEEMAEILALLFSTPPHEGKIPPVVFSKLIRSLQTFLQPVGQDHTDSLILAHKEIEKVVRLRYLRGAQADKERKLHKIISQYFMSSADPDGDQSFKGNDLRAFSELPFHLMSAGEWQVLEDTVCNLNFVLSKCQLGLATRLLEDYSPSILNLPAAKVKEVSRFVRLPKIQEFKYFVSRNLHVLLATPTLALQQAINERKTSLVSSAARQIIQDSPYPIIYWVNKEEEEDPCKMTIQHHGDPVMAVSISPDSSKLAAGFKSCIVRLYEMATGKEIHSYIGHAGSITGLCFVGDHGLCTASTDTTLSLWSVKDGFRIGVMKGHTQSVTACTANKSGKSIVSVSLDMSIRVWDGKDGKFVSVLKSPGSVSQINCVSFHPEGQLVIIGCWDSTLKIWDTFNKKKLKVLKGHSTSVQACMYLSTTHVVSAALDGEVRIWSARSGIAVGIINGHSAPINSICSTPNGQYVVTASNDKLAKVWSGNLGIPVYNLGVQSHHGIGHCLFFDRAKQTVTVGYHDGFVTKFNLLTGAQTFTQKIHDAAVIAIQIINEIHITASSDRNIKIWTLSSLPSSIVLAGHKGPITAAQWTSNCFASASDDLTILLWPSDIQNYEKAIKRPKKHPVTWQPLNTLTGHTGQISSITFSKSGMIMVTGSHDKSFIVWDVLSKKIIQTVPSAHNDWINTCSFTDTTPELLVTGSNDFNLKIWDTTDWKQKTVLKGHTSAITSVSSSQGCIISGAVDGSVKVWTRKGIEVTTLYSHKQRVNAAIVDTPTSSNQNQTWAEKMEVEEDTALFGKNMMKNLDEVLVISTSDDGSVGVWKPFVPQEITTLKGHSDRVLSTGASFRNEIVTSSLDGSIRIWKPELPDPSSVQEISTIEGHVGAVTGTSLSVQKINSERVVLGLTSGRDGRFVIWRISLDDDNNREEISGSPVEQLYRVKTSDKALSSATLTASMGAVVGSDTGTVEIWRFTDNQSPTCESKFTSGMLAGAAPLSKLCLTPCSRYLIASSLNNQVVAMSKGNKIFAHMDSHKDWVMDFCVCGSGKQSCVYSIGLDQTLIEWNLSQGSPAKKGVSVPATQGIRYSIPLALKGRREDPWPLAVTSVNNQYVIIGDNIGRLLVWERTSKLFVLTKKIHKGAITTLDSTGNRVVTGSDDGTVKIWELKKKLDVELQQVGHFYCQSSISKLSVISVEGCVVMLIGDCNGYVTVLKWK